MILCYCVHTHTHTHSVPNKNTSLKNLKKFATFAALFFCVSVWFSSFAFAQNVVTSADNDGAGSLRQVIASAPVGSEITFDLPIGTNEITLSSQIDIDKNLKIDGGSGVIISGGNSNRIFFIADATVEMKNLTLEKGYANDNGGAVIVDYSGILTAINCNFYKNNANNGGAVHAIFYSTFTAINCNFYENNAGSSASGGGAVYITSTSTFYLFHSVVVGNSAIGFGGGVFISNNSSFYSYNSIIVGNTANVFPQIRGTLLDGSNLIQGENGLTRADVFNDDGSLVCGGIVETAKVLKKSDIIHPDAANIITLLKTDQAGNKRRGFTATYGAVEAIGCPPKPPLPFKGNIIVRGGATLIIGKP